MSLNALLSEAWTTTECKNSVMIFWRTQCERTDYNFLQRKQKQLKIEAEQKQRVFIEVTEQPC